MLGNTIFVPAHSLGDPIKESLHERGCLLLFYYLINIEKNNEKNNILQSAIFVSNI